jgi:hypothetical protein
MVQIFVCSKDTSFVSYDLWKEFTGEIFRK